MKKNSNIHKTQKTSNTKRSKRLKKFLQQLRFFNILIRTKKHK